MLSVMLITTLFLMFGIGRCHLLWLCFLPEFSPSSPQRTFFSPKPILFRTPCTIWLFGIFDIRGLKMLIFQRFSSSHIVCDIPAFSFKVRIATLTRNQLIRKGPWVRIPPSPPPKKPVIKPIAGFFSMCFSINKWSEHTAVSTKVS